MTNEEKISYVQNAIRENPLPELGADLVLAVSANAQDQARQDLLLLRSGEQIGPGFPLGLFSKLLDNGWTPEETVLHIARFMTTADYKVKAMADVLNFESVRRYLRTKLCDPEYEDAFMLGRPATPVGAWSVIYELDLRKEGWTGGMVPVSNDLLEIWGLDVEALHQAASKSHAAADPAWLRPLTVVEGLEMEPEGFHVFDVLDHLPQTSPLALYLLTTRSLENGAGVVSWDGVLAHVGRLLGKNYYVMPFSHDAVMLAPDTEMREPQDIAETLRAFSEKRMYERPENVVSFKTQRYDRVRRSLEPVEIESPEQD